MEQVKIKIRTQNALSNHVKERVRNKVIEQHNKVRSDDGKRVGNGN